MAGLCAPLSTLRQYPHGYWRMTRGRCGSLLLHRDGLAPSTPSRSPGALRSAPINRHTECPSACLKGANRGSDAYPRTSAASQNGDYAKHQEMALLSRLSILDCCARLQCSKIGSMAVPSSQMEKVHESPTFPNLIDVHSPIICRPLQFCP